MIKKGILSKKKKGFTLAEIIVVLVILAVLAAVTIPSMLGFVDEAKGKTEIANARAAYIAVQLQVNEDIIRDGQSVEKGKLDIIGSTKNEDGTMGNESTLDRLLAKDLAGAKVSYKTDKIKVKEITFTNNGYKVVITGLGNGQGTTSVTKDSTTI